MGRTLLTPALLLLVAGSAAAQDTQPLMGQPVRGLSGAELDLFLQGRDAFLAPLVEADGLGPIFNEPACASCHNHPATGGSGTRAVTRFGKAGPPFDDLAALGGSLLQDQSLDVACRENVPPEADVIAQRLTPICFGAGLLEAVVDQDVIDNENNQPPGLSGFVSWVPDLSGVNPPRPARFGWKGVIADVMSFSIDAGLNEMGLTSVFLPNENAPNGDQNLLAQCDISPGVIEDQPDGQGKTKIDRFTDFQRMLAPPPQTPRAGTTGEQLFAAVGCADCHRPAYVTGSHPIAALSNVAIRPYSDFLLHDMGPLGDQIAQGNAGETHMQTRALWGVVHRDSLMHDGRVTGGTFRDNMLACVQQHDGEGAASRALFNALSVADQDTVVDFLASLGQAEFDYELDNDLDEFDWFFLEPALTGPVPSYTPDDDEAIADADQDGDFDLVDFALLARSFTGEGSALTLPSDAVTTELHLSLAAGDNRVFVAPGGAVPYDVLGQLSNAQTDGLAMFSLDLHFDGGPLQPAEVPDRPPLDHFATDFNLHTLGLNNPQGFGGLAVGNDLLQVGGSQNTIASTFAPWPTGPVVSGVAQYGGGLVPLVSGRLSAPVTPGTYTLSAGNLVANGLEQGGGGLPHSRVVPVAAGLQRELTVIVDACAPKVYCTAKPSSAGCEPRMQWKGLASMSGPDNFHLRATHVMGNETGLFLYSLTQDNKPFFGGTLCLGGNIKRTPPAATTGTKGLCDGALEFHMTRSFMVQKGLLAGDVVYAQAWYRDPAHPDGTGVGLTDAIEFTLCP